MSAPLGSSAPSKAFIQQAIDTLNELVSHGIVLTSTTVANTLVALAAELVAR
jgi:hypothetical protein